MYWFLFHVQPTVVSSGVQMMEGRNLSNEQPQRGRGANFNLITRLRRSGRRARSASEGEEPQFIALLPLSRFAIHRDPQAPNWRPRPACKAPPSPLLFRLSFSPS